MKKYFAVLIAILFATSMAYADVSQVSGGAATEKSSQKYTWNDGATAGAASMGQYETKSIGIFGSYATGQADSQSCATTFSRDYGTSSLSKAQAETSSVATSYGKKISYNEVTVQGQAGQGTYANEVGWGGAGAAGGSNSQAMYSGTCYNGSFGWGSKASIYGNADVQGMTYVAVDPFGSKRSAFGITTSSAQANLSGSGFCPGCQNNTQVQGSGQMGTDANYSSPTKNASAGNIASFQFKGSTSGIGFATGYSVVNAGGCGSNCISSYSTSTAGTISR